MPIGKVLGAATLALVAGVVVESGRAKAEVFACEGGRLVNVKPADLERLKRTDPCIASYFGLTVQDEAAADSTRSTVPSQPAPHPSGTPSRRVPTPASAVELIPIADGDSGDPAATLGRVIEPAPIAAIPVTPAKPRPPSDHRNVLLLNAEPGAAPYFRLRR